MKSPYLEQKVYPFISFGTYAGVISAYTKNNSEEENSKAMLDLANDISKQKYQYASIRGFYKEDELDDEENIKMGLINKKVALPELAYFVYPIDQAKVKNLVGLNDYSEKMIDFWDFLQDMTQPNKYDQIVASFIRNNFMYYIDQNYPSPKFNQVKKYLNTDVIKGSKNTLWGKLAGRVIKNKGTLKELKAIVDRHFEENGFTCSINNIPDEMCFGTRDMVTKMDKFKLFLGASVDTEELEYEIASELNKYIRKHD